MTDTPQRVSSNTPWERQVGYCRAIRVGSQIFVSGTTASDEEGNVVAAGSAYNQTVYILNKIESAMQSLGGELSHVVRTRMFVTNIADWPEIGRAHAERFGEYPPAATMVEVDRLVHPEQLVEVEIDAVVT